MDVTPDPALPSPPTESTAQQKSSATIPERTEEDERRSITQALDHQSGS
jgi:hypothetical protein